MRTSPGTSQIPNRRWTPCCLVTVRLLLGSPLLAQAGRGPTQAPANPVAITHVTVIDVSTGVLLTDRTVLLRERRIAIVDTAPKVRVPAGTRRIDGSGRFLIPGLWDMHTHPVGDRVVRTNTFRLFIANGITGVRDLWGDCDSGCATDTNDVMRPVPAAIVQRWKHDIDSGALIGPRIVQSSALFEGPSPMFPGSYAIRSVEDARASVRLAREHQVDFIKVLPGLSRDSYLAIVEESRRLGLPVAGHVPFAMTTAEVSDTRQRSIEHLDDIVGFGPYARAACSSQPDSLRAAFISAMRSSQDTVWAEQVRAQTAYRRVMTEAYSPTLCDSVFARLVRNDTWRVPTVVVHRNPPLARLGDASIVSDPRLQYVDARIRERWARGVATGRRLTPEDSTSIRDVVGLVVRVPGSMQRAGVQLLAGTDEPNPWVIPGFSLHDELALFVDGGLTALQALQAATNNPA